MNRILINDAEQLRSDIDEFLRINYLSRKEFSKISGISESCLSKFMNGKSVLELSNYEKIVKTIKSNTTIMIRNDKDLENMTIEDLSNLLERIRIIRNNKIAQCKETLLKEVDTYDRLLKEGSL